MNNCINTSKDVMIYQKMPVHEGFDLLVAIRKVSGSQKSSRFILWGSRMSIHPIRVKIFHI